jgi:hypothetical protein
MVGALCSVSYNNVSYANASVSSWIPSGYTGDTSYGMILGTITSSTNIITSICRCTWANASNIAVALTTNYNGSINVCLLFRVKKS